MHYHAGPAIRHFLICHRHCTQSVRLMVLIVVTWYLNAVCGCRPAAVSKSTPAAPTSQARTDDSALDTVRETFRKQSGSASLRYALQQLNGHLNQRVDQRPATLSAEQYAYLQNELGLSEDELAELKSGSFTLLDAHHLDAAFLFRDAVRSFDMPEPTPLAR